MLWIKALHIGFVISWFAGIFYLPRLFVNSAMAEHEATRLHLAAMQTRLYRFMSVLAILAAVFGFILLAANLDYFLDQSWMWLKLLLVVLLVGYHLACGYYVRAFASGRVQRTHIYFRWFNEAPVLLMFAIVILVTVRPF